MPSSWLATVLDQEQIEASGSIAARPTAVERMPDRSGGAVAAELGGRLFVRYLAVSQVNAFTQGSTRAHWVTPTAIAPNDVAAWLALPAPTVQREWAVLLDPAAIPVVRGPAWIRLGQGIEYYLPNGFPQSAILDVGVVKVT